MASRIDQMMSDLTPQFLDLAGELVPYTQAGVPRNIYVIFEEETYMQHRTGAIDTECESIEALVSSRDDTEGVTAPRNALYGAVTPGDSLVRDTKTWYVVDVIGGQKSGMQRLKLCTKQFNPDRI